MSDHPIRLLLSDDLKRNRLTVFFRLLLALPHLVWLSLWGIVAFLAVVLNWLVTLVAGRSPGWLHGFLARYVRYAIHVLAYVCLVADLFPGFAGAPGYPVDVEIAPPARQNRWTVAFRLILAVPALLLSAVLVQARVGAGTASWSLLSVTALLAWFVGLARGRSSRGLRDAGAYALAYGAQCYGYLFLLSDRYPNSDPQRALPELPSRSDPIAIEVTDELRRSRLTVFFRLLLAIPHYVWLALWGLLALLATIANWLSTLVAGISPRPLHRFLAAYLRYWMHVSAYVYLVGNPFPGFSGREGGYPVDLHVAERVRQGRWTVLLRLVLAVPALLLAGVYGSLASTVAFLGWFASLFTGRMPLGLRNAGVLALRYTAQTYGYLALVTGAYPYSGPCESDAGAPEAPAIPGPPSLQA
ncbi:MAG TPA: DUF4389 domain-containing protein [Solirubrobacteraceae bacterium]|nr:DUF4389 domain-containing protein [Solirubrobacteraceae bacterium]